MASELIEFTGFTRDEATEILVSRLSNCYVALSTTTPDADGNGFTEPTGDTGYMRQPFGELDLENAAQVANKETIFLFLSEKAIGSFTYVGLSRDKKTGSPVFLVAKLLSPLSVNDKDYVPLIKYDGFVIGLDKEELEPYTPRYT